MFIFLHRELFTFVSIGMSDDLCGGVRWWREHSGVCHCGGGAPAGKSAKLSDDVE